MRSISSRSRDGFCLLLLRPDDFDLRSYFRPPLQAIFQKSLNDLFEGKSRICSHRLELCLHIGIKANGKGGFVCCHGISGFDILGALGAFFRNKINILNRKTMQIHDFF